MQTEISVIISLRPEQQLLLSPALSLLFSPPRPPQGSRDNMSVVLVCLPNGPKVSEEAVRKDAELNKYLESRVEGECGWRRNNVLLCVQALQND